MIENYAMTQINQRARTQNCYLSLVRCPSLALIIAATAVMTITVA